MLAQVHDDFAIAEDAHGNHDEADAVGELRNVEAETRHAGVDVGAHQAHQQAQKDHAHCFQ